MVKARRALRRRSKAPVALASVLAAFAVIGIVAVWRTAGTEASVELPDAEERALVDATPASGGGPAVDGAARTSPTRSAGSAAPSAPTPAATAASDDWADVVAQCRSVVTKRDVVIARASTGIGHWSQHVQAQTDANAGRISVSAMKKSFMRTRLMGPADVRAYGDAVDAAVTTKGSCAADQAPADVSATLERCAQRLTAQRPVLRAAALGMHDWADHLADMKRNKEHHVVDAQDVWVKTWRAAPPNIRAFDQAQDAFDRAPAC